MAEILPGVRVLEGVVTPGRPGRVNVCLLVANGEITMVDAGFPGIAGPLAAELKAIGLPATAVRRIIITHHHPDHTGGLAEAVGLTGAEVWAHTADAGFIDGSEDRPVAAWVRKEADAKPAAASLPPRT